MVVSEMPTATTEPSEVMPAKPVVPRLPFGVPSAVIALKQGAGRLIRDVHDRGVLVLCDPRLTTKGYGRLFLNSLPPWQSALAFAALVILTVRPLFEVRAPGAVQASMLGRR